jgi:hypothetical protein
MMADDDTPTTPITRRDLVEGNIDKVIEQGKMSVAVSETFGGLHFENALQIAEAAKYMAMAGPMLPPWLQGNVGGCWAIIVRAIELRMSPLTLANWTYEVTNRGVKRVAFESQFYHAIIETRAPLKDRLHYEILGEGDDRRCRVWATLKGESAPREYVSATLAELRPPVNEYGQIKGSPLWGSKPDLQLFYNASRDFARIYFPDILGGLYEKTELEDQETREPMRDVTPALGARLHGVQGEGFSNDIATRIEETVEAARTRRKKAAETIPEEDLL